MSGGERNMRDLMPQERRAFMRVEFEIAHPLWCSAHAEPVKAVRVEWQGQSWFVALAQHDAVDEGVPGHWHLTLTAPDLSRVPTPVREHVGRSGRKERATTSGITWLRPDQVPGAVMSGEAQRELQKKLREIDECQARARVSGAFYVIY